MAALCARAHRPPTGSSFGWRSTRPGVSVVILGGGALRRGGARLVCRAEGGPGGAMAAVRGLRISVKAEATATTAEPRGPEPEPMEVEEGELETIPVRRSLRELIPVRSVR